MITRPTWENDVETPSEGRRCPDDLSFALAELDRLAAETSPLFPPLNPRTTAACRALGQPDHVARLINRELASAVHDPELFEARWMGSEITVHEGVAFKAAVSHLDTEPRLPFTVTSDMAIMTPHAETRVTVDCFALPSGVDLSVFDADVVPELLWQRDLKSGDIVKLEAGQGVRFTVQQNAALITLTTRPRLEHAWYFHPLTLKPISIHSSSVNAAIAQTLSDFLGTYGDTPSLEPLSRLLKHPAHFIRFAAARDMLRISLSAGKEAFEKLMSDPHPHVRKCAEATILRLTPT